jgi:tetratricopeptide (TPR) repeat protein
MISRHTILRIGYLALFLVGITVGLAANPSSGPAANDTTTAINPEPTLYEKGMQADKAGDFKAALQYFQQAYAKDKSNADIVNMLAHSQLQLGMIDASLENYRKALSLRPNFPEALEYLGEAYIKAALREIENLKGYGKVGDEQRADLIKALREAAANVK